MALETGIGGMWVLQALCGVETMPVALRCPPYIPSVHGKRVSSGEIKQTPEYRDLVAAGAIVNGVVDRAVAGWLAVIGAPEREVMLALRRPGIDGAVGEQVMVVCRRGRWLAKIARYENRLLLDAVGQAADTSSQTDLFAMEVMSAIGDYAPADVSVVNLSAPQLDKAMGAGDVVGALVRLGAGTKEAQVLASAAQLDRSAMAVVLVIDHRETDHIHQQVLTVADTEHGRMMLTSSRNDVGAQWLSMQAGTSIGIRAELSKLLRAA